MTLLVIDNNAMAIDCRVVQDRGPALIRTKLFAVDECIIATAVQGGNINRLEDYAKWAKAVFDEADEETVQSLYPPTIDTAKIEVYIRHPENDHDLWVVTKINQEPHKLEMIEFDHVVAVGCFESEALACYMFTSCVKTTMEYARLLSGGISPCYDYVEFEKGGIIHVHA